MKAGFSQDAIGRLPMQERSRRRRDSILSVARDLIGEAGSDRMKMSELASRAGISIGSLYQYFPDKGAVIRALAEAYNEESRACISTAFAQVHGRDALATAYLELVDQYFSMVKAEPVMRDIWSGTQADKELAQLELEECQRAADLLAGAMVRAGADPQNRAVPLTALLIWQLGESAVRLAIAVDHKSAEVVMATFKEMSVRQLLSIL